MVDIIRTPKGVKKYGAPIGTPIVAGKAVKKGRTALARLESAKSGDKPKKFAANPEHTKRLAGLRKAQSKAETAAEVVGKAAPEPKVPKPKGRSEAEYLAHRQKLEEIIDAKFKTESTHKLFAKKHVDAAGNETLIWDADRAEIHKEIIDEMWKAQNADNVPNQGRGIIAGGLGGAGKSTVLKKFAGVDQSQFITANPDDVKEVMAARGLTPKIEGLAPMETAALVHEESSHIAMQLAMKAQAMKKNMIWDITMASGQSTLDRLVQFRDNGYTELEAVFVDIPVEKSVERALGRYRSGMDRHLAGEGMGGRYVPPKIIRENTTRSGNNSMNRDTFEGIKQNFQSWGVWDNSIDGREPVKIAGKGRWA